MSHLAFFRAAAPLSLATVAAESGAHLPENADPSLVFRAAAPLGRAEGDEVAVFCEGTDLDDLLSTRAGACLIAARHLDRVPPGTVALVTDHPREAFRRLATMLHPRSVRPASAVANEGIDPAAHVHPSAQLEFGVVIDPGAIVGPDVEIGARSFIGAHSVLGAGVRVGRDCALDAHVSVSDALLGDRVIIHAGARIGQGARDLRLGRVIIQNDVEIGANVAIERGRLTDTVIGEGSQIGGLVTIEADRVMPRCSRLP